MTPFAHIAGLPIEEAALSLGPALFAGGWVATVGMRRRWSRMRNRDRDEARGRP